MTDLIRIASSRGRAMGASAHCRVATSSSRSKKAMASSGRVSPEWPAAVSSHDSEEEKPSESCGASTTALDSGAGELKAARPGQGRVPCIY
jgi:hypothetical protein